MTSGLGARSGLRGMSGFAGRFQDHGRLGVLYDT
jgi:hypothetical protein